MASCFRAKKKYFSFPPYVSVMSLRIYFFFYDDDDDDFLLLICPAVFVFVKRSSSSLYYRYCIKVRVRVLVLISLCHVVNSSFSSRYSLLTPTPFSPSLPPSLSLYFRKKNDNNKKIMTTLQICSKSNRNYLFTSLVWTVVCFSSYYYYFISFFSIYFSFAAAEDHEPPTVIHKT